MQKLNSSFAEAAKILPFVGRFAAPPLAPAKQAEADAETMFRPQVVALPSQPAALSPAAALGHDARNALASLRLLVSLIGEPDALNASYQQAGQDLQHVASLLERLVEQLIACQPERAAAQASAKTARKVSVDAPRTRSLNAVLESCTGLLRSVAGDSVEVYVSAEAGLPPVGLEEDDFLRILINLVLNASEAMPGGGTVRITARRALSHRKPAVLLHVSDNGPGIPRLALSRIFEPGFTSKRPGPHSSGSGLGLTIVRELLHGVGGGVEVASTRGRGTTFELRLPCFPATRSNRPSSRHTSVTGAERSETLK